MAWCSWRGQKTVEVGFPLLHLCGFWGLNPNPHVSVASASILRAISWCSFSFLYIVKVSMASIFHAIGEKQKSSWWCLQIIWKLNVAAY